MIIKRTTTEYLNLDRYDWIEDLEYWLDLNSIGKLELTLDLFIDYINSTYNDDFESYDSEIELEDISFEDIYNEYIKRNND